MIYSKIRFLTAPFRVSPDFIIVGEAKCGTTSLYSNLNQLACVLGSDVKEPNNFIEYGGSPLFCKSHYPLLPVYHFKKWRLGRVSAGEASAEYFSKPNLPETIHQHLPAVKIICLFRDPVKRAYSDWQMLTHAKRENRSFSEVVDHSLQFFNRPDSDLLLSALDHLEYHPLRYLARGIYIRPLRRWMQQFPQDQLLCLSSETFFKDPAKTVQTVGKFLGVDCETDHLELAARKKGRYQEPCPPELQTLLREFYRPWNLLLEQETGLRTDWEEAPSE